MKIMNTAAMHQWGADDYSFGYIAETRKGFEIRFVAGFPPVSFPTLLDAIQFVFRAHPMAYVGQVGLPPDLPSSEYYEAASTIEPRSLI